MKDFKDEALAALERLPEEMQRSAVAYLLEQADKLEALRADLQEGLDDIKSGRVWAWNLDEFLADVEKLPSRG
ncbi:MAG: hypothetical protein QOD74_769 [Variibacter sp.]|jgi:hypothetical protein|nr:hypothetical protein [Variibacter sp.]